MAERQGRTKLAVGCKLRGIFGLRIRLAYAGGVTAEADQGAKVNSGGSDHGVPFVISLIRATMLSAEYTPKDYQEL